MKKNLMIILGLCLAAGLLAYLLFFSEKPNHNEPILSVEQLREPGRVIAVSDATPEEVLVKADFVDAEILTYSDIIPAYTEVANGKIDAAIHARREMETAVENGISGVQLLEETYCRDTVAVGLSRQSQIPDLKRKVNAFLTELRENGTLDDMYDRWVVRGDTTMPEIPAAEHAAQTLRVATTGTIMPYSYYVGEELAGYDIELAKRFASWLGMDLEFRIYTFGGILASAQTGEVDCIMSNLYYTPEHEEAIDFSEPLFEVEVTAMVKERRSSPYTMDQLDGKRIGILTGSIFQPYVEERLPNAELSYYSSISDLVSALKASRIDAFPLDEATLKSVMRQEEQVTRVEEYLDRVEVGMVFAKSDEGQKLCDEVSEWLAALKESGELEQLLQKWNDGSEEEKNVLDPESLPAVNGMLAGATAAVAEPFTYLSDGKLTGFEMDLVTRFCKEKGYGLRMDLINFDGILIAVAQGQADFGVSGFAITEERKESVLFSEPYYQSGTVMAVLKEETEEESFWDAVISGFEKTFIREDRWKLLLQGTCTTLFISVLAVLLGTVLGFAVYMSCRKGNPVANAVTRFCIWLVQGMPVVVFLMILYYIVFGKIQINGIYVSVIGFTILFGSAVYTMLKTGIGTVDRGQAEAACALGFPERRAFFRIVLPQAMPVIMPSYTGQITTLVKATAVVGYIAVQDLTKMGDIIRSRTYEAFFPLIAVAVVYFVLAAVLTFLVRRISRRFDTKRRGHGRLLKGVTLHD